MPERVRQGLVENAGGQLMCPWPKCRLPVTMHYAVVATKPYTTHVNHIRVSVVAAAGGELANTFATILHITCEAGHAAQVSFETEAQGTRCETWWDDDPQPKEGELDG
jgi:hypothetical protein